MRPEAIAHGESEQDDDRGGKAKEWAMWFLDEGMTERRFAKSNAAMKINELPANDRLKRTLEASATEIAQDPGIEFELSGQPDQEGDA